MASSFGELAQRLAIAAVQAFKHSHGLGKFWITRRQPHAVLGFGQRHCVAFLHFEMS